MLASMIIWYFSGVWLLSPACRKVGTPLHIFISRSKGHTRNTRRRTRTGLLGKKRTLGPKKTSDPGPSKKTGLQTLLDINRTLNDKKRKTKNISKVSRCRIGPDPREIPHQPGKWTMLSSRRQAIRINNFRSKNILHIVCIEELFKRNKKGYFLSAIVRSSKKREKISFSDFGSPLYRPFCDPRFAVNPLQGPFCLRERAP